MLLLHSKRTAINVRQHKSLPVAAPVPRRVVLKAVAPKNNSAAPAPVPEAAKATDEEMLRSMAMMRLTAPAAAVRDAEKLMDAPHGSPAEDISHLLHKQFLEGLAAEGVLPPLPTAAPPMPAVPGSRPTMQDIAKITEVLEYASKNFPAITSVATMDGDAASRAAAFTDFELKTETLLEKNCVDLLSIIDDAATSSGQGFATVKVSSLGDPRLLKHLSKSIGASGSIAGALTPAEEKHLDALVGRLEWLVSRAQNQGVKLIIAAERASLRPAVDAIARELMRQYNRPHGDDGLTVGSVIFTTYQAYMRDAQARLAVDLALAEKEGYILGAKLVGGVDPHGEASTAQRKGIRVPVWDSEAETEICFNGCVAQLNNAVKGGSAELMVATRSTEVVKQTVSFMTRLGLKPEKAPVFFNVESDANDDLSQTLGSHGCKVFKYSATGNKILPYEIRAVSTPAKSLAPVRKDLSKLQGDLIKRLVPDNEDPAAQAAALVSRHVSEMYDEEEDQEWVHTSPSVKAA
ncbi:hypothetical protein HYH02_008246 [Chlamydomonas schloesseri]|uniref:Proline dehydrogenase n=1 Tax=Chlamydomonas schloesseri TaxID=2026947 RepID=A0A836B3X5_9CHLO|nr:hypothetical protein HYH02_008246 [Chlamydomonas schloesseri]|eukprot:KAG2446678.1 hypothetical protein HYH02_008246 [Chlamydomonas schloesseri]